MSWSPLYRPCTSMSPWSHRPCYYILVTTDLARQWVLDRTDLVIMSWSPLYRPCTSVSPWLHRPCYYVLVSTVQTLHVSKSLIAQTLLCPGHHCTDLACQRVLDHTDLVIMSWSPLYRPCMSVSPWSHRPCYYVLVTTVQTLHVSASLITQTLLLCPGHLCTDSVCQCVHQHYTHLVFMPCLWSTLHRPRISVQSIVYTLHSPHT